MGVKQGQGGLAELVIFLDENHCRNPHILHVIEEAGLKCEKHLEHFEQGTEDIQWLPVIGQRGWCLLTTDARIRKNFLEREAVRVNRVRMFYFSRNDMAGLQMGAALRKAMPHIIRIIHTQEPPFTASISKNGEVVLRDKF